MSAEPWENEVNCMKLAPIEKKDFALWRKMRREIYPIIDPEYDQREMEQISVSGIWFCYFIENETGETIGLVELSSRNIVDNCLSSPVAYLEGLYLEPECRGRGLGKQAARLVFDWCRERGFSELATDAELANTAAQNFYRALGFEETDRVVEYRMQIDL
jgi:aminoglycoside 6'-N-acetyltransferase I